MGEEIQPRARPRPNASENCPLCDGGEPREIFRAFRPRPARPTGRHTEDLFGRAGRIVRCSSCGIVRQLDPPTAPYEEAADPEYLSEERGIRQTFRRMLDRIERHHEPGRLLDVGCGPGLLLDEARTRGWTTYGIEPSAWGVEQSHGRGLDVIHGTLESVELEPDSFDAIVAADVIEHVADPTVFAARIHSLLSPGGVVFIATPNIASGVARLLRRWWWSVIPNHLWFFSPETLGSLLRKASLDVVETSSHPKTFSLEYYAGRFGGYSKTLGALTRGATRLLGAKDRLVTPDFRDRIAMIARKA
jgi:SAM-dependent methyltransferase